jgi:SEC-C motif-containing protein
MDGKRLCPCGSGGVWQACCGPIVAGEIEAPTAEALMRSRYSAYATRHVAHVARTSGGAALAEFDAESAAQWAAVADFKALEVVAVEGGGAADTRGTVTFRATFDEGGKRHVMNERSRFEKVDGRWLYVGHEAARAPKAGRNDPCPCGSGLKFKRCCGR